MSSNDITKTSLFKTIDRDINSTTETLSWMKKNFGNKPFFKKNIEEIEMKLKKLEQLKQDCINNNISSLELYTRLCQIK